MEDKEDRKRKLEEAKARLAKRKRERAQLKGFRDLQRQAGGGQNAKDFGQAAVAESKELIQNLKKAPNVPQNTGASASVPGRRTQLSECANVNEVNIVKRDKESYHKEVGTDAMEIAQDAELITETTTDAQIEAIMTEFMQETIKPWPPVQKQGMYVC